VANKGVLMRIGLDLVGVDERTAVFKIRNGGNFDFAERKWLSTAKLTRLL
jgi:hypothetical protein